MALTLKKLLKIKKMLDRDAKLHPTPDLIPIKSNENYRRIISALRKGNIKGVTK